MHIASTSIQNLTKAFFHLSFKINNDLIGLGRAESAWWSVHYFDNLSKILAEIVELFCLLDFKVDDSTKLRNAMITLQCRNCHLTAGWWVIAPTRISTNTENQIRTQIQKYVPCPLWLWVNFISFIAVHSNCHFDHNNKLFVIKLSTRIIYQ